MNSNYGKAGSSLNSFDFDLGIGSNRSRPLNDQKNNKSTSYGSSYSNSAGTAPSWQPNKPSWTHQPAPARPAAGGRSELGGPTSMVGDIFGKSWNSAAPSPPVASVGAVNKNPNLFGDLVSSALGQNKSSGSTPLKSAAPASVKSSFSMGSMGDSLPKSSEAAKGSGRGSNWGSSDAFGSFVGAGNGGGGNQSGGGMNKSSNLGGSSAGGFGNGGIGGNPLGGGAIGGGGGGLGASTKKDPFGSLFDLGSKPSVGSNLNSTSKAKPTNSEDWGFGGFQNAPKPAASTIPPVNVFSQGNGAPLGSNQAPSRPSGFDSFDTLFPSSGSNTNAATEPSGNQESSGGDDWGFDSGFGGGSHDEMGGTTELDGLPPPPAGVSASSAKGKGLENYKQGQYADAIKWLSWAVILLEKSGNVDGTAEVLTCRASCYKEVGEYKKAVADCSKVLDHEGENVAVLVQRALLYESMEKYKLGAEDLRTVMKLDPANRVARSTIHRLTKMID